MEKQEKAYKGVIEYFKNRIMAGELPVALTLTDAPSQPAVPEEPEENG